MNEEDKKAMHDFEVALKEAANHITDDELRVKVLLLGGYMTGLIYRLDGANNSSDLEI